MPVEQSTLTMKRKGHEGVGPRAGESDSGALPIDAPGIYPFPKNHEGLIAWDDVEQQLQDARHYWLATVRGDGRPHVTPVWGAWIDGAFHFQGAPTSRWARNLQENPAATLNLESGKDVVIVEGVADFVVTDAALAARLIAAWQTKYGAMEPAPETEGLYRLQPRTIRAWGESLHNGARWISDGS